jgi:dihydrofolate reductase
MNNPIVSVIAAYADDGGYGLGNYKMPWSPPEGGIPGDLLYFRNHTNDAPNDRVNVLVAGRHTFTSMGKINLGVKRVLVGVSKTIEVGAGYGPNRQIVGAVENAFLVAEKLHAHRIIFVGGVALWLYGLDVADEVHITIAHRLCSNSEIKRLKKPLHAIAHDNGMTLVERKTKNEPKESPAWAKYHERQVWRR